MSRARGPDSNSARATLIRRIRASGAHVLPADPVRALLAVLAFPDRHARLEPIDELATRREGLAAMCCAGRADHRDVAHGERARAMQTGQRGARQLALD